jgi:predicted permease
MATIVQELRVLGRRMRKAPGFAFVTVLTLGLGIGATVAMFAVVYGVLFRPLPFVESDRLVALWHAAPGVGMDELNASPTTHLTYTKETRAFTGIALWRDEAETVTNESGAPEPERVTSLVVSHEFLPVLGVRVARGRGFTADDDRAGQPETVILTHGFWQRRFGGNVGIIGRRVVLDGRKREVIGVMPPDFQFLSVNASVLLPFQFDREKLRLGNFSHQSVGRLRPGVNLEAASADVARMIPMVSAQFPPPPGMSLKMFQNARLAPRLRWLKDDLIGDVGKYLWVLLAALGIVLSIACANVANLLLVRMEGRGKEIAVRAALGSTRLRLAREILFESGVLGILGGILGIAVAQVTLVALREAAPPYLPRLGEIRLDAWPLTFGASLSILTGVLLGLLPVARILGGRWEQLLRTGGRTMSDGRERNRARNVLVVAQVALAVVLLVGAGLLLRTLDAIRKVEPGFRAPESVAMFRLSVPEGVAPNAVALENLVKRVVDRMGAIVGVWQVSVANAVPMSGNNSNDPVWVEGRQEASDKIPAIRRYKFLGPGYFATLGNALVAGREFTWTDVMEHRPVVQLSESLAMELFGGARAAMGKRVRETTKSPWREVVGVARDERDDGAHMPPTKAIYWPFVVKNMYSDEYQSARSLSVLLRTDRAGSAELLEEIRRAMAEVSPTIPVAAPGTLLRVYQRSMARTAFTMTMLAIAAGLALLLGVIGIYGVLSYAIAQRTREIGIRVALGASEQMVSRMFVGRGIGLAAVGVLLGVGAAIPLGKLMESMLYGVGPWDPLSLASAAVVLVVAAALASYLPARRAARISPLEALGAE